MGKSSINGPFTMAMLNNQRVYRMNYLGKFERLHPVLPSPGILVLIGKPWPFMAARFMVNIT